MRLDVPLMVGNDPVNDMVAGKAGLKTYLADDAKGAGRVTLADSKDFQKYQIPGIPEPDFKGPISDVIDVIQHHLDHP